MTTNNVDVYNIELPDPSPELLELTKRIIFKDIVPNSIADMKQLNELNNNQGDAMGAAFFSYKTESLELTKMIREEFGQYFPNVEIASYFGLMAGDYEQSGMYRCIHPHVDVTRNVNINYFIDIGGDDVQTWFYDKIGSRTRDRDAMMSNFYPRSEITPLGYCKFEKNKWYMFNSTQVHSIEKLQSSRYFVAIMILGDNLDKRNLTGDIDHVFIDPVHDGQTEHNVNDVCTMLKDVGVHSSKIPLLQTGDSK